MKFQIAISLLAVAVLAGCSTTSGSKSNGGPFSSLTGSKPASSDVLAALGNGLIGNKASLDTSDRKRALQAEYQALEYSPAGKSVEWKNCQRQPFGRSGRGTALSSRFAKLPPVYPHRAR